mmetsp:Transcript_38072/g.113954  ORF Transcript_38072/g.113954 Transcript_38072/m.113954 type:complete len:238 (+) Transcript_38072:52-765(+)
MRHSRTISYATVTRRPVCRGGRPTSRSNCCVSRSEFGNEEGAPGGQYWSRSGGPLPAPRRLRARGSLPAPSPISLALAASGPPPPTPPRERKDGPKREACPRRAARDAGLRGQRGPGSEGRGRRAREDAAPPLTPPRTVSPPRTGPIGRRGSESGPCPPTRSCRDAAATRGAGRGRGRGGRSRGRAGQTRGRGRPGGRSRGRAAGPRPAPSPADRRRRRPRSRSARTCTTRESSGPA